MAELRSTSDDQTPIHFHSAADDLRMSLDRRPLGVIPPASPSGISEAELQAARDAVADLSKLKREDPATFAQVMDMMDSTTRDQVTKLLELL